MADMESLKNNGHSTMLVRVFQKLKQKIDTKVDKETGKGLSSEDYTSSEKTKLQGIESGAQVNTVTGVKGNSESSYRTGNVNITATNIGLGNVGNFKAVSTAANQGLSTTEQSNARANIGAGTSSFSGSYTDLTNKPTIPTVNNATLTVTQNGTDKGTFTANQGTDTTIALTDTNNRKSFFGTCATAAATATKDVTLSDTTGWELSAGTIVGVKFSNSNTASSVKLNVNGTGAKSIYFANAVYTGAAYQITGWKDYIIYYMYDGTNWVFLNNSYNYADSNNYVNQAPTTTSADYEVLFSYTADNTVRTEGARKSSNFLFNPSTGNLQIPQLNGVTIGSSPKFTDTTYESKAAASGGTDVSLVTTGEKYTWNSSNSAAKAFYGTCSTAAATATKVVTLSSAVGWNLVAGVVIGVKFSNNNTASSVKLDVNGSGAKSIYFGNAVYAGTSVQITGWKDYIIYYMYDGTNWMFLNNSYNFTDSNNYVTQTATTTSADYEVLFSNTADNTTRTEGARKNSNLTFNPSTGDLHTTQLNGVTIGSSPKFTDTTYSNATQSEAGLMSASDKTKLDKMYTIVTTEAELTSALATSGSNILVANSFTLTHTINITQNNTNLTFNKNVVFDMTGKNFAFITVGANDSKPTYVNITNPKAMGNKTSGSIGINLLGVGFGGSINSPTLQSFDTGIKTNSFDCAQLISLYEPVVQGCNVGIDDSLGGLQAVRIYGGRIEGNTNWGVKIGSPNANFMGTVIEGNGTNLSDGGEVYFTNVSTNRSSAVFVNCYFETLSTTAGNIITANSNWLGNVSLTNCEFYNLSIPVFTYTGSDTKERAINITGGNVKGTVMLNVPNVGNSTSIFISNVLYDDSTNAIDANIGANANKFISGKNVSTTSIVRGKSFMAGNTKDGVASAENVYSKILQIDTPSGNNNFIRLTQSASNPWADASVGILKGSLHYNSATNKWYQRITSKGTIDAEANWSPLILATTPHKEISTSGSGNSKYFSMPDKSQWLGKKLCICAWRTNENDVNTNPPKFMWEFYVPTNWAESSDDFDVYSAYRGSMATLHDTYVTLHLDYSNNRISLQDDGFYARNLNGTNFYLYLYHSLMTYKLVIL